MYSQFMMQPANWILSDEMTDDVRKIIGAVGGAMVCIINDQTFKKDFDLAEEKNEHEH